ncbi:glutathione S-transferase family protein [Ochrobactrum sp. MYb15]|uniref:glutathione S-transferase family protein n=1 Tax=Brucella TaxID=234 RepID=UPI00046699E7|nr:glutathione S-transferase family protein [Brucella rhizosphaerae]PQZ51471.1 glutathione S-transferase family protein [Ochrobactrum sp. MYb19]PRA56138.1 glutathione S-transferase family protein [Ochrobactrum sp. MYb68]PRA65496.1 glutathione S-transferase family protein [Ochrobactrum sp. MYb18]PRA77186.1 glutathione S-transferase family protein [Brucella thiophenivorans]PRA93180.1 glutathione S-transferase family protein [Ochrobactrum sp. MYb14]PRA99195.1 glutathione S-transferase family pro
MLTIYSQPDSGNCYKPRLLLAKLGKTFKHVTVSSLDGSTRTPEYLAKNPNGKVPLLELDDGRFIAESNAMLLYLAENTRYLPKDAYERALVYQWLFFEQYSHEPYVAVRRALMVYPERARDATPERLASTLVGGDKALAVMEEQLKKTPFLVGNSLTVADIALYAYTHEAHRGGFNMELYPAVNAWLARVAADEGHVSLDWLP